MFIDAAALVAVISGELEGERCSSAIAATRTRVTSAIAVWEASAALGSDRKLGISVSRAEQVILKFLDERGIVLSDFPPADISAALSIQANERYGRGKRRLNLADCFHYACAKHYGVPILSTADEFRLTDIEVVP